MKCCVMPPESTALWSYLPIWRKWNAYEPQVRIVEELLGYSLFLYSPWNTGVWLKKKKKDIFLKEFSSGLQFRKYFQGNFQYNLLIQETILNPFSAHAVKVCHHHLSLNWKDHFKSNPFFVIETVVQSSLSLSSSAKWDHLHPHKTSWWSVMAFKEI